MSKFLDNEKSQIKFKQTKWKVEENKKLYCETPTVKFLLYPRRLTRDLGASSKNQLLSKFHRTIKDREILRFEPVVRHNVQLQVGLRNSHACLEFRLLLGEQERGVVQKNKVLLDSWVSLGLWVWELVHRKESTRRTHPLGQQGARVVNAASWHSDGRRSSWRTSSSMRRLTGKSVKHEHKWNRKGHIQAWVLHSGHSPQLLSRPSHWLRRRQPRRPPPSPPVIITGQFLEGSKKTEIEEKMNVLSHHPHPRALTYESQE